jgi:hypothetical protein
MISWLPEYIIFGKPRVIDVWVGDAKSVAAARDLHYHQPPRYLVFEPEDTSARTANLQQTNTNGYRLQGKPEEMSLAEEEVKSWGPDGRIYRTTSEYQRKIKTLLGKFDYRLDTNFAKMDRIQHAGLESFKTKVLGAHIHGHTIKEWSSLLSGDEQKIRFLIEDLT